ncbi:unnamed protein product, partial [Mesorhabditis belari]|uniref:Centromere protein X n=1 Tax=Mesorhabditis belari TaxID=2138241 RepID=A0AAF3FCB2_9BILA
MNKVPDQIREPLVNAMIAVSISSKQVANPKPMSKDVLPMLHALTNEMIKEMLTRAATLASNSGRDHVTSEEFQRILPQILLDFAA